MSAVAQYTTPNLPPENPWIDRTRVRSRPGTPGTSTPTSPPTNSGSSSPQPPPAPLPVGATKTKKARRPPSRRLIRHVLRARIEAAKSLGSLLSQLERSSDKQVRASSHLARTFGGHLDEGHPDVVLTEEGVVALPEEPAGWRSAGEVLKYLRSQGAKISGLSRRVDGDWAAVSSEGEGTEAELDSGAVSGEDMVWIAPETR